MKINSTQLSNTEPNRRQCLRRIGRLISLLGLVTLSAILSLRKPANTNSQTCSYKGLCRNCRSFPDCSLPRALKSKHILNHEKPTTKIENKPA